MAAKNTSTEDVRSPAPQLEMLQGPLWAVQLHRGSGDNPWSSD